MWHWFNFRSNILTFSSICTSFMKESNIEASITFERWQEIKACVIIPSTEAVAWWHHLNTFVMHLNPMNGACEQWYVIINDYWTLFTPIIWLFRLLISSHHIFCLFCCMTRIRCQLFCAFWLTRKRFVHIHLFCKQPNNTFVGY